MYGLVYRKIAEILTEFENHKTTLAHNSNLFRKLTAFYFVNNFGTLIYIAFVKVANCLRRLLVVLYLQMSLCNESSKNILDMSQSLLSCLVEDQTLSMHLCERFTCLWGMLCALGRLRWLQYIQGSMEGCKDAFTGSSSCGMELTMQVASLFFLNDFMTRVAKSLILPKLTTFAKLYFMDQDLTTDSSRMSAAGKKSERKDLICSRECLQRMKNRENMKLTTFV